MTLTRSMQETIHTGERLALPVSAQTQCMVPSRLDSPRRPRTIAQEKRHAQSS